MYLLAQVYSVLAFAETMVLFAKELDDEEIAAVAAYYQQVRSAAGAQ